MKTILLIVVSLLMYSSVFSQKVGIGTTSPLFKLDVVGGSINTDSVYRIGSNTVLSVKGLENLFVGKGAGRLNASSHNTFNGHHAGYNNTTGLNNSFFGFEAGRDNSIAEQNSFFGSSSGNSNTTGTHNSFFGAFTGNTNTIGAFNSFFGAVTGSNNTTGESNSFFGVWAGSSNSSGMDNSFFGRSAGYANTTGINNSFFGRSTGYSNSAGLDNSFFGTAAGPYNTTGSANSFFGRSAGELNTTGKSNSFFGMYAGFSNTTGTHNTVIGDSANVNTGVLINATAIGARSRVNCSNCLILGSVSGVNGATSGVNVGIGVNSPIAKLDVTGNSAITGNFLNTGINGTGLVGSSLNTSGQGWGVYGEGGSVGVEGVANLPGEGDRFGVSGHGNFGTHNFGVKGDATSGTNAYGVYGSASGAVNSYGVYGAADGLSGAAWAGYFYGDVFATRVGIGINAPTAKLSISADGTELTGTAASNLLRTNAGVLGNMEGDEISLANIGFASSNNSSLGIRAHRRIAGGNDWTSTALLIGYDVDNTPRAGGGFLAISANGSIGISTTNPAFPLSFPPVLGDKISLWSNSTNSYGFGIQSGQLQIHTDISAADIVFGYGSSDPFNETMRIKGTGNVGIGTSSPAAPLHVEGNSVLFSSTWVPPEMAGPPPIEGEGVRMMWYADKSALRAGDVDGTQWDQNNVGRSSFASGFSTTAYGFGSVAMGDYTYAGGPGSVALGSHSTASGLYGSYVMGKFSTAAANYSTAIGLMVNSNSYCSISLGSNNDPIISTPSEGWILTEPILIVGNGTGSQDQKNALVILKNGNVGIGINAPAATLDVARGTGGYGTAAFHGTTHISHFNFDVSENTFIRAGKNDGIVFINDIPGGKVIIGTGSGEKLTVNGDIWTCGNITSYSNSSCSDIRYKTNLSPLSNSLDKVMQLHGINYDWKRKEFPDRGFSDNRQIGFSAQEVETMFPELVMTNAEGYKSVDYGRLTPVLVEAIKEQQKQIVDQQKQIDELKKLVLELAAIK